eukprot:JP446235.1.p1 GENE.JP446235.1~~JP446235.1.p1  ORF type:complete len:257 (+),score=64.38 JP446235.1:294-1064(+)
MNSLSVLLVALAAVSVHAQVDMCGITNGGSTNCTSFVSWPPAGQRFSATEGSPLTATFNAKAGAPNMQFEIKSWSGPAANTTNITFASSQSGAVVTATWTWAASSGNTDYALCLDLKNSSSAILDTICVNISITFCQHLSTHGETLITLAPSYNLTTTSLWWLNPAVPLTNSTLIEGQRVWIGRVVTAAAYDQLQHFVRDFGVTWAKLLQYNPGRVHYQVQGAHPVINNVYKSFGSNVTYVGTQFCLVSSFRPSAS